MNVALLAAIEGLPVYSTHEHIGSLAPMSVAPVLAGSGEQSFREDCVPGAEPEAVTLLDLVFAPYLGGVLASMGYKGPWPRTAPDSQVWETVRPFLRAAYGNGCYMALSIAFPALYDISLEAVLGGQADWRKLSAAISQRYASGLYAYCKQALGSIGLRGALRPVHGAYLDAWEAGAPGDGFFTPILRIDDWIGWQRNGMAQYPEASFEELQAAIQNRFAQVLRLQVPAMKQLQAYSRSLDFGDGANGAQAWDVLKKTDFRLDTTEAQTAFVAVGNACMHQWAGLAVAYNLPHQIHTGMANLTYAQPALLDSLLHRGGRTALLHCQPYHAEAGYMAHTYRNVWVDAAWLALQSQPVFEQTMTQWLGWVPYTQIHLSADATSVEECYGAWIMMKRGLARVLADWPEDMALSAARAMLYDNALREYAIHENAKHEYAIEGDSPC